MTGTVVTGANKGLGYGTARRLVAEGHPGYTAARSGRPVACTDLPADEYRRVLDRAGLPGPAVELIVDADVQIARGALSRTTGDLSALLGRPATPLAVTVGEALGG
ncbi:hypothetical protein ACL02R_13065 [Streptomyces sp. MS19]|uniref:hypothetical protein n=1 Tax=Streptomyces sp. MS19 TaxID=3385972 RepID=UPI00399F4267